ncbi:hypothetical protein [Paenibacillus gallinarum]|uniref:Lipoprotein n=1 Tax=Paenibacillus gallinarum TaxID=2762232 RepID=A0ABR8T4U2_9BACL|nr:hypothetical protein [Paenibacillus gallinarum]MBD7970788.1 hypothetical protein [Paenibacillus gallinarum]
MRKRFTGIAVITFAISIIFMGCTNEDQSTEATIARSVQPAYEKTFTDLHLGEAHFYRAFIPNGAEKWVHFGIDTYIGGQLQEVTQELSTGNFIEREDDEYDLGLVLMNHGDKILAQLNVDGTSTSLYELPKAKLEEGKGLSTSWVEALPEDEDVPLIEGEKQIVGAYLMNTNRRIIYHDLSDAGQLKQAIRENHIMHILYMTLETVDKIPQ